jgi:exopolysaccharide biosynthesis polyprenyl glycosylphosphotransferase
VKSPNRRTLLRQVTFRAPLDIAVLWTSFLVAFLVRFGGHLPSYNFTPFLRTVPWLTIGWIGLASLFGLYEASTWEEIVHGVFLTTVFGAVLAMAISFLTRGFGFPRSVLVGGAVLDALLELWILRHMQQAARSGQSVRIGVIADPQEQERILALIEARGAEEPLEVVLTSGISEHLGRDFAPKTIDVLLLGSKVEPQRKAALALEGFGRGLQVYVLPSPYEVFVAKAAIERWEDALLLGLAPNGPDSDKVRLKRLMDVIIGSVLLLIVSPLIGLIALAIRVFDGAPVLYRQERIGRDGRIFSIVKFRTMVPDAEAGTGPVLATAADPRVTRLGACLRAYRLDELPQLWNVLRGDMSLVGPRPERPDLHRVIAATLPDFNQRLRLPPGLTGLAQINGRYDTTPADKLRHDLVYYGAYSPLLDIKIMLRTIRVIVTGGRGGSKADSGSKPTGSEWTANRPR